jgi:hypothetical protein
VDFGLGGVIILDNVGGRTKGTMNWGVSELAVVH